MKEDDVLELTLSSDEMALEPLLEKALMASSSKRVILKFNNGDKVSIIERLRDFLSANINMTVIVYVE